MSPDPAPDRSSAGQPRAGRPGGRAGESDAWAAFGLVVSGVLVWGGAGILLGRWLDSALPAVIGLLVGMAGGLYLVWFRYGRA